MVRCARTATFYDARGVQRVLPCALRETAHGGSGRGGTCAFLSVVAGMTTAAREFGALVAVPRSPMLRSLLGGATGSNNAPADAFTATCSRAGSAVATTTTTATAAAAATATAAAIAGRLGHLGVGYVAWLQKSFNPSQLEAIEAAATSKHGGSGSSGGGSTSSSTSRDSGGFTLVQGPPGTGKTTTLKGLLNTLHQRDYNAYYQSLLQRALSPSGGGLPGLSTASEGSNGLGPLLARCCELAVAGSSLDEVL